MGFFTYIILIVFRLSAANSVEVVFVPSSDDFAAASKTYAAIWMENKNQIVESMERISKRKFSDTHIKAIVFEGVSSSGKGSSPMRLRASYSQETKKATLIHELGHRLLQDVKTTSEIDEHRKLFLVLYDVWTDLYGKQFADRQVEIEKQRKRVYPAAWAWALSLTKSERKAKLAELTNGDTSLAF